MFKILIVENNEYHRKNLMSMIDELGHFMIVEAGDTDEGIEKIRKMKPDIVISDIDCSIQKGFEMLENTKGYNYGSIILTASHDFEMIQRALRSGISDYLIKPISQKQLKEALERAILQHRQLLCYERALEKEVIIEKHIQEPMFHTKDLLVEKMLIYIHDNYMHKIVLNDLTEELHYSQTLLNKRFKKVTSMTFCDYLNRYRITKAIEMMKEGQKYIYDIAAGCGFHEYKYFSVVFKKYAHCSLKEFMQQIEN